MREDEPAIWNSGEGTVIGPDWVSVFGNLHPFRPPIRASSILPISAIYLRFFVSTRWCIVRLTVAIPFPGTHPRARFNSGQEWGCGLKPRSPCDDSNLESTAKGFECPRMRSKDCLSECGNSNSLVSPWPIAEWQELGCLWPLHVAMDTNRITPCPNNDFL